MKKTATEPEPAFIAFEEYPEQYHLALQLLIPLWRGIPGDYKRKYARNIWQQFEDNIRAAAYTATLSKFINSLCSRMSVAIAADDLPEVHEALNAGRDRDILRQLRGEATTLVLMVRLENEKRKAEWEARRPAVVAPEPDFGALFGGQHDDN